MGVYFQGVLAERVGFEPTAHCCVTGFQDQLLKPLGHLSKTCLFYKMQNRKVAE